MLPTSSTIDPEVETLVTLNAAGELPANVVNGKPRGRVSVWRDATVGRQSVSGDTVKLETLLTPRGLCTSVEAVSRFIARLNDRKPTTPTKTRQRQIERADKVLLALGVD